MQRVNIGDRVRFLNTTGGGVVKRITADGVVYVQDESGFELPVLKSEVVVVTEGSSIVPKPERAVRPEPAVATRPKMADTRRRPTGAEGEQLNLYFCVLPVELGQVGKSGYEVYLVNDSNYDLLLLYTSGRGMAQVTRFSGVVPFDSSEFLEEFDVAGVPERTKCTLQIIAYKDGDIAFRPKQSYKLDVQLDSARLFKENAFKPNPFFDDDAIIVDLVLEDRPVQRHVIDTKALVQEMMTQKLQDSPTPRRRQRQEPKPKSEPLVIDLHINELVDTTRGMGNKEMLDLQLGKVEEVMEKYNKPKHYGREIVFIHGKGEGVLRAAVRDLVRRKYPKADQQDASFQEYGFGATKVTIR